MMVYVVTATPYPPADTDVKGVFTSRSKAQQLVDKLDAGGVYSLVDVECWDTTTGARVSSWKRGVEAQ